MHLNKPYGIEKTVKKLAGEFADPELKKAYEDILKFNNEANEMNYMIDVYKSLKKWRGGGEGFIINEKSWGKLFREFDDNNNGSLAFDEFEKMIKKINING